MNIQVHSRYRNFDLNQKMREFIPDHIPVLSHDGFHHWTGALHYLQHIIQADCDYVVNVDEDCFIYDWKAVEQTIQDMHKGGIAYAGMPDSLSYCQHRNNSEQVMNPFFNIFDVKRCREVINTMNIEALNRQPAVCRFAEPFNSFFYTLYHNVPSLSFPCTTLNDGISTNIGGFALHSWYSREYGTNPEHTARINNIYLMAKERIQ